MLNIIGFYITHSNIGKDKEGLHRLWQTCICSNGKPCAYVRGCMAGYKGIAGKWEVGFAVW